MKYIKVTRSDIDGSYIMPLNDVPGIVQAEFDDIEYMDEGVSITLTIVEMSTSEYSELDEFLGW